MKSVLAFLALIMAGPFAHAESLLERIQNNYASVATCNSLAGADVCVFGSVHSQDPAFDYTRAVAFVIPKNEGEAVSHPDKIMLHIQGFRGVCRRASDGVVDTNFKPGETLENFNMINQFLAAIKEAKATNSVLVFPVSYGQNSDYRVQLVGHFRAFMDWTNKIAQPTDDAGWYISGHSGAGTIIPDMLAAAPSTIAKVRSLMLQDATYGVPGRIDRWRGIAKANVDMSVESVFIDGSSTSGGSRSLKANLGLKKPMVLTISSTGHCSIPNRYYKSMLARALSAQ